MTRVPLKFYWKGRRNILNHFFKDIRYLILKES